MNKFSFNTTQNILVDIEYIYNFHFIPYDKSKSGKAFFSFKIAANWILDYTE